MELLVSMGIPFSDKCPFQYVDDIFLEVFWVNVSVLDARLKF